MSFLSETVLAGSTRLYIAGGVDAASKDGQGTLRKNQSHGGLFTPLIQLVRDPVGTIGGAVGSLSTVSEIDIPDDPAIDRRQVLYLRMRNVSALTLPTILKLTSGSGQVIRRMEVRCN
jgi:TAG lipase/steryl ester hydrolase/phospholipase A2/LPA acyltransferase